MEVLGDTLFTDNECPFVPKKFLWWKWQERTHRLEEICRWSEPGHYSTIFYEKYICTKCHGIYISSIERDGP
jgi:hypothetical protein